MSKDIEHLLPLPLKARDIMLSKFIVSLVNLERLNLSSNDLDNLEFIGGITSLKEINLSNNSISNLDLVIDNEGLEILDLSNNKITDISKLQYLHTVKKIDLSDNEITNINPLSSSYSLESLFLNNNPLKDYRECLANLEYLKELGVGHCNIPFTDVKSLKYLSNLTYLDLSGTSPDINLVSNLKELKTLILESCRLDEVDVSPLNKLVKLETLDISNNDFDLVSFNDAFKESALVNLQVLKIGGNAFPTIPNLSSLTALETLDLTDSYNLTSIESLATLKIKELVLDRCNYIDVSKGSTNYISTLESMENLKKLSIVGGFNYVDKALYEHLVDKVNDGELELRFIDGRYVDAYSIYNYSKSVFFDLDSFLAAADSSDGVSTYSFSAIGESQHIILSIVNDNLGISTKEYNFLIDKSITQFDIYADQYKTYNISINIQPRKESRLTLGLSCFNTSVSKKHALQAADGSKLLINVLAGSNSFVTGTSETLYNGIKCYDLQITNTPNSTLFIKGSDGVTGQNGQNSIGKTQSQKDSQQGKSGTNGGAAVSCRNCKLSNSGITIVGGSGGTGGRGGDGLTDGNFDLRINIYGGNGGTGGTGGTGVEYKGVYENQYGCSVTGGAGGAGGAGGHGGGAGNDDGSAGNTGAKGKDTLKK